MKFWHNIKDFKDMGGFIATIGNYDGVHIGHQQILREVIAQAKSLNLSSLVIIFEPQPVEYFQHTNAAPRLTTLREKVELLQQIGIENVFCQRFDAAFANISPQVFIEDFLLRKLQVKYLIVGDDFLFGRNREGNFALLQEYSRLGLQTEKIPAFYLNNVKVSSTYIRKSLAEGKLELVKQLLGRSYTMSGKVGYGDRFGRVLGFPTANIYLQHKILPISGVYKVVVHGIEAKSLIAIANVGFRPTVDGKRSLLEVHILNFSNNVYGKRIHVEFLQKIRDERKFANIELLKRQIAEDVKSIDILY